MIFFINELPEIFRSYNNLLTFIRFPLFTAVHEVCSGQKPVHFFIDALRNHPEHL